MTYRPHLAPFCLAMALVACGGPEAHRASAPAAPGRSTTADSASASDSTIVFLGTSLTAGLGVDPAEAYPALIQAKLDSAGLRYRVVNAGVSGESSAGALRRIEWILRQPPAVLVIETGANDGLRGQDPDSIRANIQAIIDRARALAPQSSLLLVGMEALPNLGQNYARRFRAIYPTLARENRLPLIPFLLAGVAGVDSLNQADGIHPTPRGHQLVAANVWPVLEHLLRSTDERRTLSP